MSAVWEVGRLRGDEADSVFDQMAEIHREVISEGFLSTLGPKFLVTLYRTLSSSESAFAFAASDGRRVAGFIVGATDTRAVYREFLRRAGFRAVLVLAPRLFSLGRLKRVVETLLYPRRRAGEGLPEPEILNFCVRPEIQGQGVGGRLFDELCREFSLRGVSQIRIVTGEGQKSAQAFYEKHGARPAAVIEVHQGSPSRVYVHNVASASQDG